MGERPAIPIAHDRAARKHVEAQKDDINTAREIPGPARGRKRPSPLTKTSLLHHLDKVGIVENRRDHLETESSDHERPQVRSRPPHRTTSPC